MVADHDHPLPPGGMTPGEFASICDCVANTGNASHCMRLTGRPVSDLYRYLRRFPDEKPRMTMARMLYQDEIASNAREIAFHGIPAIRRGERGQIMTDETGAPIFDRVPSPQLIAAVLREGADRLARAEQSDLARELASLRENRVESLEAEIIADPPPALLAHGKTEKIPE